jgi:hypothetical protein
MRIMALTDDLERSARTALERGGAVSGVLAVELLDGTRVHLCAYESGEWLALDGADQPVTRRKTVHDAVVLSALCEVAEESMPDAERGAVLPPPRLATDEYLDALGAAARRAEQASGIQGPSPFGAALEHALPAVEALAEQVLARHLTPLT